MKNLTVLFLSILMMIALVAGFKQPSSTDENSIRAVSSAFQDAINHQDVEKLASLFAEDAIYHNPLADKHAENREEVAKLLQERFEKGKNQIEIVIQSIDFTDQNEATEKGVMKITSTDKPIEQIAFQIFLVKENDRWLIDEINQIELEEPPSQYEHLKPLEWMIGKWKDTDPNVEITFDTKWDRNKNFILQDFKMEIFNQNTLEGRLIIGWDAADNAIKAWVFDSDGGFGSGTWEQLDKNWYANMNYTLSDGSQGSAKNVYAPIDANSYTFASVERELDGEILPDVDPVKVIKAE